MRKIAIRALSMREGCGETKCPHIKQWDRTNPDGYLVTQYDAPASAAPAAPSE